MESAWRARFFTIWTGQQLSHVGTMVAQFALIWWVTRETGSAIVLANASIIALAPSIFLSPFVGPLIDRWNRRILILASDTFIALVSLWLAYLFWSGELRIIHIYTVMTLRALGSVFHNPAFQASIPLMVPREHLARIAGASFIVTGLKGVLGPSLGALAMELLPLHGVMMIDVGTALLAILPIIFLSIPQPAHEHVEGLRAESYFMNLKEGLRFTLKWKGMMILITGVAVMQIVLVPAFQFIPLLIREYFGKSAVELGIYQAFGGGGLMLGGAVLTIWGGFRRRICTILWGFFGLGVAAFSIGLLPPFLFWPMIAISAFMGLMSSMFNGATSAVLQAAVPKHIQGRVISLFGSLLGLAPPIGLALGGLVAERFGVPILFRVGGAVCVLLAAAGFFVPSLLGMETEYADAVEMG